MNQQCDNKEKEILSFSVSRHMLETGGSCGAVAFYLENVAFFSQNSIFYIKIYAKYFLACITYICTHCIAQNYIFNFALMSFIVLYLVIKQMYAINFQVVATGFYLPQHESELGHNY